MSLYHYPIAGAQRRRFSALYALCFGILFCAASAAVAADRSCVRTGSGRIICQPAGATCLTNMDRKVMCSPVDGGIELDRAGKFQCGTGYCVLNADGKVFCSKVPRGASSLDQDGKPVCTGGCMEGQTNVCITPSP